MFGPSTNSAVVIADVFATNAVSGLFTAGNAVTNTPATTIDVDYLNIVTLELSNLVTTSGQTLSKPNTGQIANAVTLLAKHTPGLHYNYFSAPSALAAGSTTIIGPSGVGSVDNAAQWVLPYAANITGVYIALSTVPGGAANASVTVFANAVATPATTLVTSVNTIAAWSGAVTLAANTPVNVHVVMSSGAASAYARGWFAVTPQ